MFITVWAVEFNGQILIEATDGSCHVCQDGSDMNQQIKVYLPIKNCSWRAKRTCVERDAVSAFLLTAAQTPTGSGIHFQDGLCLQ